MYARIHMGTLYYAGIHMGPLNDNKSLRGGPGINRGRSIFIVGIRWLMFCTGCGEHLSEGAKFCPSCGTQSGDSNSSNQEFMAIIKEQNEQNNKKYILIGIAFLCLFLIFKPGYLGITMYDKATWDCEELEEDDYFATWEVEQCFDGRSEERVKVGMLGIVAFICLRNAMKSPESEEESDEEE